jgi:hypothetical protein
METVSTPEQFVSLREFAKMTGTSDGGVRKAIIKGSIKDGFVDGKILPSVASMEWGKAILEKSEVGSQKSEVGILGVEVVESADTFNFNNLVNDQPEDTDDSGVLATIEDVKFKDQFFKDIPEGTDKVTAERLYAVFRARKMKRELQKLESELVDKRLVFQNLYEFASILRDGILNVPERVIDNLRAADTRNEALLILTEEIEAVLKSLSGIGEIKLSREEVISH